MFQCVHVLQIREEIRQFGINIYQFPECDSDEDEDFKKQDQILKVRQLTRSHSLSFKCAVSYTLKMTVLSFLLLSADQHPICSNWE